jgi:hypothetical protein
LTASSSSSSSSLDSAKNKINFEANCRNQIFVKL